MKRSQYPTVLYQH